MKKNTIALIVLLLSFSVYGLCASNSTLVNQGKKDGRSYHEDMYKGKDMCADCHGTNKPVTYPDDKVCMECHDVDELVSLSTRPAGDEWQNPHNNLHYGKDTTCTECHGEHIVKKTLCENCHTFDFSRHKD